jgi:hypothetical protein
LTGLPVQRYRMVENLKLTWSGRGDFSLETGRQIFFQSVEFLGVRECQRG